MPHQHHYDRGDTPPPPPLDDKVEYHVIFPAPSTRVVAQATTGADKVLDFAETAYLVKGARITVNEQDYTAFDALRLATGGSASTLSLKTPWCYVH